MRARTWITGLSATALVTATVVVGGGTLSNANATGPTAQPAGTLTLATASGTATTDAWTYDAGTADTSDDVTQPVAATSSTSCLLTPTSGALVGLTGTSGSSAAQVGFVNHAIGVTTSATVAPACGQVNTTKTKTGKTTYVTTNESLTIALNNSPTGALGNTFTTGDQATSATLDIAAFDDSNVTATTYLAGSPVATYYLIADEFTPKTLGANTTFCLTPYMLTGKPGLCTWNIGGGNFDSITLTSTAGWFSLNGGGEWGASAASHRTTFSLVSFFDGTLDCTTANVATANGGGAGITGVALTRLDNGNPAQGCVALPYDLGVDGSTATFHKPNVDSQSSAQFAVQVTRHYAAPAPYPVPVPLVDWEDGQGSHSLALCPAGFIGGIDGNGNPTAVNFASLTTANDQSPNNGIQFACVYKPGTPNYNLSDGSIDITDSIYFTGDIKFPTP